MKALIFIAIMIVGSMSVQDDGMEIINKMEESSFGRNMMDTIQLQIQSGDPADDLIHMLKDEEDRLDEEQDADDEYILALENQCVEDLAKLVDEIAQTRKRIQELEDLLDQIKPIKIKKENEKSDLEDFAALIKEKLVEIDAAKKVKDAEWAAEAEEHDQLTAIIQKAKNIIQGALTGFLQTNAKANTQVLAQVSQHFAQARKQHFKRKSINTIFKILSQISATAPVQADQGVVGKIIELCDDLLNKIAESRAIEKTDYDHWVKEYQTTHDSLSNKLAETEAQIQQLTVEINVLTKRISIAENELTEQKVRLEQKISQHDEREAFCDGAGKKYAHDREVRSDQKEVISDAIGLLVSKIRLLKRYVSDRVTTLEKPMF